MSMPSDVTPDVAVESAELRRSASRRQERWSTEQRGLAFAALIAFLGVAYFGPQFRRMTRKPRLVDRAAIRFEDARRRARNAGSKARKRARRLGGGSIR